MCSRSPSTSVWNGSFCYTTYWTTLRYRFYSQAKTRFPPILDTLSISSIYSIYTLNWNLFWVINSYFFAVACSSSAACNIAPYRRVQPGVVHRENQSEDRTQLYQANVLMWKVNNPTPNGVLFNAQTCCRHFWRLPATTTVTSRRKVTFAVHVRAESHVMRHSSL